MDGWWLSKGSWRDESALVSRSTAVNIERNHLSIKYRCHEKFPFHSLPSLKVDDKNLGDGEKSSRGVSTHRDR